MSPVVFDLDGGMGIFDLDCQMTSGSAPVSPDTLGTTTLGTTTLHPTSRGAATYPTLPTGK